jgi:hypothetical protein
MAFISTRGAQEMQKTSALVPLAMGKPREDLRLSMKERSKSEGYGRCPESIIT